LKTKVVQLLPTVKEFVEDTIDTALEFGSIATELGEEEESSTVQTQPIAQLATTTPTPSAQKAFEQAQYYIEQAVDSLEQAYRSLRSLSRRVKIGAAFVTVLWLLGSIFWANWALLSGAAKITGPANLLTYIVGYLLLILIGPFFIGIVMWIVIGIEIYYARRLSRFTKIVKKNLDALRGIELHSFSPGLLHMISTELKVLLSHINPLHMGKAVEAVHHIEEALYYLQKAAEALA